MVSGAQCLLAESTEKMKLWDLPKAVVQVSPVGHPAEIKGEQRMQSVGIQEQRQDCFGEIRGPSQTSLSEI